MRRVIARIPRDELLRRMSGECVGVSFRLILEQRPDGVGGEKYELDFSSGRTTSLHTSDLEIYGGGDDCAR
jgi:hypothetical protein